MSDSPCRAVDARLEAFEPNEPSDPRDDAPLAACCGGASGLVTPSSDCRPPPALTRGTGVCGMNYVMKLRAAVPVPLGVSSGGTNRLATPSRDPWQDLTHRIGG